MVNIDTLSLRLVWENAVIFKFLYTPSTPEMPEVQRDHKYFKSPLFFEYITDSVNKIKSAINAQTISHEE